MLHTTRITSALITLCAVACGGASQRPPAVPPAQAAAPPTAAPTEPPKPQLCDAGSDEAEVADEILARSGRGLLWLVAPADAKPGDDASATKKKGATEVRSARSLADCLLQHIDPGYADVQNKSFEQLEAWVAAHVGPEHAPALLAAGAAYFASLLVAESWIDAAFDVPIARLYLERATAAAPQLSDGLGPLILGAYLCAVPKAVGGQADVGKQRLEAAASHEGRFQLAMKVAEAEFCAFSLQDRALFDRLLADVDTSPGDGSVFDLLAKQHAKSLHDQADDMFPTLD